MNLQLVPVSKTLARQEFDCGDADLNTYFRHYAVKNDLLSIGKTFVGVTDSKVAGYFTVSTAQIAAHSLPENIKNSLPRYPVPAFRIGKLAVDKAFQGFGVGRWLLWQSLEKALSVSAEVAVYAVLVDAVDEKARDFYMKYGFIPFSCSSLSLFLPMETLRKAKV